MRVVGDGLTFDDVLLIDPPAPLQPPRDVAPVAANAYAVLYRNMARR